MTVDAAVLDGLRHRLEGLLFPGLRDGGERGPRVILADNDRRRVIVRLRANALRVSPEMTPRLEAAARAVAAALGCPRSLFEVYVFPRSETNAFCFADHLPVTIGISSEAVRVLDDLELRFLLGHELGHACFRETEDDPSGSGSVEGALRARSVELTVDRVGLLAACDVEASCRAIVKTISGLQDADLRFDFARFAQDVREMEQDDVPQADILATHPPLPIRFRSLLAFARSDVYSLLTGGAAHAGVRLDTITRTVERALDRAVDARARTAMDRAVGDMVLWLVAFAIVNKIRVSIASVAQHTGVAIDRGEVEQALGLAAGFPEGERSALVQDKVNAAIAAAMEVAPRRTLKVAGQVREAVPGVAVAVQVAGHRFGLPHTSQIA